MRKIATIPTALMIMLALSAGAAQAITEATEGDDLIKGTAQANVIHGLGGNDVIRGLGGADELVDGRGRDALYGGGGPDDLIGYGGDASMDRFSGGGGDDTFQSRDVPAVEDIVSCGAGTDKVYADKADVISEDCEGVKVW